MQLHGNARTTPYLRREMVRRVLEQAKPVKDTAAALSVSERTVFKWEMFATHGVSIQRVMTDNGPGYISKRFNLLCQQLNIRHIYTKPYTPRTNGKAERFIRTLKEQWAYGTCYRTSAHRARALVPWTNRYNRHRPHAGIGSQTPMSRLKVSP